MRCDKAFFIASLHSCLIEIRRVTPALHWPSIVTPRMLLSGGCNATHGTMIVVNVVATP
jgi:hypothetical protein